MDRQIYLRIPLAAIAAALVLAPACKRISPEDGPGAMPPIAFASAEAKAVSAAEITDFDVWGTQTSIADPAPDPAPVPVTIFNGIKVSKTPGELEWTYSDTRYWIPENYYQFWAISPHSSNNIASVNGNTGIMSLSYNIAGINTTDLLYATDRREYGAPTLNASTVQLTFNHALSRIHVKFVKKTGDPNNYTINSVAISPVETKGNLAINSATASATWSDQTAHTSLNFTDRIQDLTPPVEPVPNNENIAIFATGTFYAIPQATTSISCTISYTVEGTTTPKTKSFDFISGGKWEGNTIYNYTILLQESYPIVIGDVYVVPWGEVNRGATIVIK